jgi:16S rRNA (guanine1207-N2)-methyltransferase
VGGEAGVYGWPPPGLARAPAGALQLSPFDPAGASLEALADESLDSVLLALPAGTIERRYALAQALRALRAGGAMTALAPKNRGGTRLAAELALFGCDPAEEARRHHRICSCARPAPMRGLDEAIALGGPQIAPSLGLWSQPGVFSWDGIDPGSALLMESGLSFKGKGADIGCGVGVLALKALEAPMVTGIVLVDIDARAVAACRRNVTDPRASFVHADIRQPTAALTDLDFVVMNPPFHAGGLRNHALGQEFIACAAAALSKGGTCRLVANAALPYEVALAEVFSKVVQVGRGGGYKLFEAIK